MMVLDYVMAQLIREDTEFCHLMPSVPCEKQEKKKLLITGKDCLVQPCLSLGLIAVKRFNTLKRFTKARLIISLGFFIYINKFEYFLVKLPPP